MAQVDFNQNSICIDGKKTVILCASLFYFRIPRAEWEDRIIKLKACGYNCVDVYFPWNFHETTRGHWVFDGEKDVLFFLDLLKKHGMYVVARPGPYICSEWDGGGVPAWILTDNSLKIRENDIKYMAAVRDWYHHILPIISDCQIDHGGTVIFVQLENELDFYDCQNPRAYMEALRDLARAEGITVPVFGCAGQSNIEGATGWASGVDISFNFYGDVCDPYYGEKFHYYAERMGELNRPLLVTETSCDHLFVRRQLAAGAKLLGPYNQVGGTNFGFTGSVNNWGERDNPLSFITTYYTGEGMIGSAGELHTQYYEGRRLAGFIRTFGEALAGAQSVEDKKLQVFCNFPTNTVFYLLKFAGGGSLLCVPNLGEQSGTAKINWKDTEEWVTVHGHSAPFFPLQVPLSLFGRTGILLFSNGELENSFEENGELVLTFWTESEAPFAELELEGKFVRLTKENPEYEGIRAVFAREREIRSLALFGVEAAGQTDCSKLVPSYSPAQGELLGDLKNKLHYVPSSIQPLEQLGVYRGMGGYRFNVNTEGVLLLGGSDIVSVYRDNEFAEAYINGGGTRYISGRGKYEVLTAIWGHSNFADARQPALMLNAAKGLHKAIEVHEKKELESNWAFSCYDGEPPLFLHVSPHAVETLLSINFWNSTRTPLRAVYRKTVRLNKNHNGFVLELRNPSADAVLYVDGEQIGLVNPLNPFIDLSPVLAGKETAELAFCVTKRDWNEPVGFPVLFSGREIKECEFAPVSEEKLTKAILEIPAFEQQIDLPFSMETGKIAAVKIPLREELTESVYLRVAGKNIFVAAWAGNTLLGRVLLWGKAPKMCGIEDLLYLPKSFCENAKDLRFLIASLDEGAELSSITIEKMK